MYEELTAELRIFETVCKHSDKPDIADLARRAADAIESASKAYQMMAEAYEREVTKQKWIPVTEALPKTRESILGKKSSKVIVAFHFDDGTQGTDIAHTINGEWKFEDHITVVTRTITNWMPLPQPPKEE